MWRHATTRRLLWSGLGVLLVFTIVMAARDHPPGVSDAEASTAVRHWWDAHDTAGFPVSEIVCSSAYRHFDCWVDFASTPRELRRRFLSATDGFDVNAECTREPPQCEIQPLAAFEDAYVEFGLKLRSGTAPY